MTSRHENGAPRAAAGGGPVGALVYFSSVSENTARFVADCRLPELGINVHRLPLRPNDEPLAVREPYVLMTPTYGGGSIAKAVPVQVKRFLNDPANRAYIRGVIASGNTNFGEAYGVAGDVIAAKCHVPFLYRFELMGTPEDRERVRDGLVSFFRRLGDASTAAGDADRSESPNPTSTNESE
ncbi:class Ib ribonucleoside-diphosphate reductase assembly flavoprotein NrdI [Bifidobacterium sp. SMB2]|uniref:Protein NrdI n=1 Tax=Bifidobacterium saimiriisciurei TaxID=2661627 RepID=A0ABX0C765_9BIFI|nr:MULTISPECIES: class Ib ribonucleoside-diphosphate reductase assembly flavoprotein NrdI [Bifidobacterium]NEG96396.1 class Ib ribonucleoside-diphosphate reductase assembly flavoprotein NrdI [Bifidobacterium sp. SMB2]NEH10972.1 class Ib ribonucleoside-diphosphate reductase assembly flavoprotein NrdI [Bifidobacterium saimiriisciurei]